MDGLFLYFWDDIIVIGFESFNFIRVEICVCSCWIFVEYFFFFLEIMCFVKLVFLVDLLISCINKLVGILFKGCRILFGLGIF